jgi:phosphate transport system substrate-binding protein
VFITHIDNPVDGLTVGQIQGIYTGAITNWSEVGGLDQEIVSYQREPNSGSQTTMEQRVMDGLPMIPAPMARVSMGMGMLVDAVGEYVNRQYSLGYTFKFYIDNLYKSERIKVLAVDGILPGDETIRDGSYPFGANYYAVYRAENRDSAAGRFAAWILSEEGQRCVAQAGYIPLHPLP